MKAETSARDYASGFLAAAVELWSQHLTTLADRLEKDGLLRRLSDQAQEFAGRNAALTSLLPTDFGKLEADLLQVLLSHGDLSKLREVVAELNAILQRTVVGAQTVAVTSAQPLAESDRQALQDKLSAQFGAGLEFHYTEDPTLLGGMIVRVGDKLIDTSVASRLSRMREQLAAAVR